MTKPSVLQIVHGFIEGGSERQMIQLSQLLQESGQYAVHIASLSTGGVLRTQVEGLGIPIADFPLTSFYDRNMVTQLRRFSTFLKEHRIQIVHSQDFYSNIFGMTGAALGRTAGRVASRRETAGTRTANQKKVERCAFRLAHAVVANAEAVRNYLIGEGVDGEKIVTIHNGIDMNRFATQLSKEETFELLGLSQILNRRLITMVANFEYEVKDYPTFLRAAKRVVSLVPEAAFVIAGDGELKEATQSLARDLGLMDCTFFIGRCARIPELLAISQVCVLSSKAEGFSNSILEYMAASRPVVATNVGGAGEAIVEGNTGYLVPAGDDQAMGESIIRLLRDPDMARSLGRNGRQRVEQDFSCEARLRKTVDLYEKLVE